MYENITKFELICMRLKIWWLTRKARRMKKLRAKSQPRKGKVRQIRRGVQMKRCSCCRKSKPESEFWANKAAKDGLMDICKQCSSFKSKGYKTKEIRSLLETEEKNIKTLGGWRINILNHAKERENRFNMIEIGGDKTLALSTNDKELFKRRICEIINSF